MHRNNVYLGAWAVGERKFSKLFVKLGPADQLQQRPPAIESQSSKSTVVVDIVSGTA